MRGRQAGTALLLLVAVVVAALPAPSLGWGVDGHLIICQIAQGRLSDAAAKAVNELLPSGAGGNLSSLCSWADRVRFRYHWSAPLHFIDVPDNVCSYSYDRDCKDEEGVKGRCVAGAINNYTSQLLTYGSSSLSPSSKSSGQYNLTEALLFLSHFMGDIHQPLHCGFASDRGGNTIDVHWYRRKTVLHHVWDVSIIQTAEKDYYDEGAGEFVDALNKNITGAWSDKVQEWEECAKNQTACPDKYGSESITAACDSAYKGVTEDSTLSDEYFGSRLPVVNLRLAQGGVRLAATLNRIFGQSKA
ncbi:endonuclease 2 [Aegilops tauschii subsp. strangulata]|uniref:Aspergillus nuclease S1 n=2 Tax=Aegilops tauschii subsp. strangulata TaxID=200361 RepID=A0A453DT50_AEGTS|nr:endonuclease 2 [Aegilops tauschii subsp. strangulata]